MLFPVRVGITETLSSKYQTTKLILHIGCLFNHPISQRKSALTQTVSVEIPKAFNQNEIKYHSDTYKEPTSF